MADDEGDKQHPTPIESLRDDRYFATWQRDDERPSEQDVLDAAWASLDQTGSGEFADAQRMRAMRKVALLQIVAPYFTSGAPNWESVFELLSPKDRQEVEDLLGNDSLDEVLY